jgi:hypothetical protein
MIESEMKLENMVKKISSRRFKKTALKQPTPTIADYLSATNPSRPYLDNAPKTKNCASKKNN